jgi:hypothetical protein
MNRQRQPAKTIRESVAQLNLVSVKKLEYELGVSRATLRLIAEHCGAYYSPFIKKEKTRPFQKTPRSLKLREIDNPIDPLKDIQQRINKRLLDRVLLPDFFNGGVRGKRLRDNIDRHLGAKVLVTLDIASFFPTVKPRMVYKIWREVLGCSPSIAGLLTKLTTYRRRLPQGASTSTSLANLVLAFFYPGIVEECRKNGVRYSTWIDDLAFSGESPQVVIPKVVAILKKAGFKISRRKLKVMTSGEPQVLNNLLLNGGGGIGRPRLSQARAGIHKLQLDVIASDGKEKYVRALKGRIAFINSMNNRRGEELMGELDAAMAMHQLAD